MNKIKNWVINHQFASFISLAILIALVMTGISLMLYRYSGAIVLDMSRPGYEKVRGKVEKSTDNQHFDSNSKLDAKAIEQFNNQLNKYQSELSKLGNFSAGNFEDSDLGLVDQSPNNQENNTSIGTLDH